MMFSSRQVLLLASSVLLLLIFLPSSSSSPGHYVHDYYKNGPEQSRSARHLKSDSSSIWIPESVLSTLLLVAAVQVGRGVGHAGQV